MRFLLLLRHCQFCHYLKTPSLLYVAGSFRSSRRQSMLHMLIVVQDEGQACPHGQRQAREDEQLHQPYRYGALSAESAIGSGVSAGMWH